MFKKIIFRTIKVFICLTGCFLFFAFGIFVWWNYKKLPLVLKGKPVLEAREESWGSAPDSFLYGCPASNFGEDTVYVYENGEVLRIKKRCYKINEVGNCSSVSPEKVSQVVDELLLPKYEYREPSWEDFGNEWGFIAVGTSIIKSITVRTGSQVKKINSNGFGKYFNEIINWCASGQ